MRNLDEALILFGEPGPTRERLAAALAGLENGLGPEHRETLLCAAHLGRLQSGMGESSHAAAIELLSPAAIGLGALLGPDAPRALEPLLDMPDLHFLRLELSNAERLFSDALELSRGGHLRSNPHMHSEGGQGAFSRPIPAGRTRHGSRTHRRDLPDRRVVSRPS
jgi:hypothetical protein